MTPRQAPPGRPYAGIDMYGSNLSYYCIRDTTMPVAISTLQGRTMTDFATAAVQDAAQRAG